MEEEEFERRLRELERRSRQLDRKLSELSERERRLHNLILRLAAAGMVVSEVLQKRKMIEPAEFEKRVETHLRTLDQEISGKKILRYLEKIWKEFEEKND